MAAPQLTINLIPGAGVAQRAADRPKTKLHIPRGLPLVAGLGALGALLLLLLVVFLVSGAQQRTLTRLRQEWDTLAPRRVVLVELQAEQERLDERLAVLTALVEGRLTWAQRFNDLSNL